MKTLLKIMSIAIAGIILIGVIHVGGNFVQTYEEAKNYAYLDWIDRRYFELTNPQMMKNMKNSYETIKNIPIIGETL